VTHAKKLGGKTGSGGEILRNGRTEEVWVGVGLFLNNKNTKGPRGAFFQVRSWGGGILTQGYGHTGEEGGRGTEG